MVAVALANLTIADAIATAFIPLSLIAFIMVWRKYKRNQPPQDDEK
jgi:hypothetical protein